MAVRGTKNTLLDLARVIDPNGNLAVIAEVLTKTNEILLDALFAEANDTFSHRAVRRTSKPTGTWRDINKGVPEEKSTTKTVIENIGMLDGISKSDIELVRAAPSPEGYRMQIAESFLEGMSDTLATTLIYGNSSDDTGPTSQKFDGLAKRMSSLVTNGRVVGTGGTGNDNTSMYMVQWGLGKVWMATPKGSTVGIEHEDRGVELTSDSDSNEFRAYVDYFSLKTGLVVEDDRCIARIANIEPSGSTNIFDPDDVITVFNRMPRRGAGAVLYANSSIITQMEIQAMDKQNVYYTAADAWGNTVMTFRGHPVRLVDAILNTEDTIT